MSKVLKGFYCTQEKKTYCEGDDYKGKRTDLGAFLESSKKENKKQPKAKLEKK